MRRSVTTWAYGVLISLAIGLLSVSVFLNVAGAHGERYAVELLPVSSWGWGEKVIIVQEDCLCKNQHFVAGPVLIMKHTNH